MEVTSDGEGRRERREGDRVDGGEAILARGELENAPVAVSGVARDRIADAVCP